jgi:predicted aspartyl protease
LIEGLVDTNASMSIMAANAVRKFGIMHLILGHKTYKTTSRTIIQALGKITNIPITISKVVCQMIFLVVDNDNYDLSLGLDFLMKLERL